MQVGKGAQVDGAARVLLGAQVQHILALDIGHHLGDIRQNGAVVAVPWRVLHLNAAHGQYLCYCALFRQSPCEARLCAHKALVHRKGRPRTLKTQTVRSLSLSHEMEEHRASGFLRNCSDEVSVPEARNASLLQVLAHAWRFAN